MPDKTRRRFHPALRPTLAMLTLLPVLVALGIWQLDRAAQKARLDVARAALRRLPPLVLGADMQVPPGRRVIAEGRYDRRHSFLLDNRVRHDRAGYAVLTPLRLAPHGAAVLVERGWLASSGRRDRLPPVSTPGGPVRLEGEVWRPSPPLFALSDREAFAPSWPKVVQTAVPERLARLLGYRLLPFVVSVGAASEAERAVGRGFGPARHRAYAVQWFALALVLVGGWVALSFGRKQDER